MDHKVVLSLNEKNKRIAFLKKQRDGKVIGQYRNILADIYKKITKVSADNNGICLIESLQEMFLPSTNHEKNVILDYCLDLEQLGYIQMKENGEINIIREMDF